MFRQTLPQADLTIEEGTERVPDDGRYYVLYEGAVLAGYGTLRGTVNRYRREIDALGIVPERRSPRRPTIHEVVARDRLAMSNKELFWTPEDYRPRR